MQALRSGFVAGIALLTAFACGGRSTSDFTLYEPANGGLSSKAGSAGAAQGGGAIAGSGFGGAVSVGGADAYGGSATGGTYGGTVGVGGAYAGSYGVGGGYPGGHPGKGGAGGTGGAGGAVPGDVVRSCSDFCEPLARICPQVSGDFAECTAGCSQEVTQTPGYCRQHALGVLDCMTSAVASAMTCNQALIGASACSGGLEPFQCSLPPNCGVHGSARPSYCELVYECPGETFGIQCAPDPSGVSSCYCMHNGAFEGQIVHGYGYDPCGSSFASCHF